MNRKRIVMFVLSIGISAFFLLLAFRGLRPEDAWDSIRKAQFGWLLVGFAISFAVRLVVSCAAAAAAMLAVPTLFDDPDRPATAWPALVAAGVPGAAAYVLVSRALGMQELRYPVSSLRLR